MENGFNFVKKTGGLATESQYDGCTHAHMAVTTHVPQPVGSHLRNELTAQFDPIRSRGQKSRVLATRFLLAE